jgi:hypothetical protein
MWAYRLPHSIRILQTETNRALRHATPHSATPTSRPRKVSFFRERANNVSSLHNLKRLHIIKIMNKGRKPSEHVSASAKVCREGNKSFLSAAPEKLRTETKEAIYTFFPLSH